MAWDAAEQACRRGAIEETGGKEVVAVEAEEGEGEG